MHMIKNKQMLVEAGDEGRTTAEQFYSLAASYPHRRGQLSFDDLLHKIWPCTCSLRLNTRDLRGDRHQSKKVSTRGLSWPPSGPPPPDDALDARRVDARRLLRPPPRAAAHPPACLPPHWLGPRRHAAQEHLPEGPDMVGEPRRHGRRTKLPLLG